jgi:hypothetical protein
MMLAITQAAMHCTASCPWVLPGRMYNQVELVIMLMAVVPILAYS